MTQGKVLRVVSPADVASRSCAAESQPGGVARCSLGVGWREEIEKLGSDPIIMTPANPSRSHLLEILRTQILSLIPMMLKMGTLHEVVC